MIGVARSVGSMKCSRLSGDRSSNGSNSLICFYGSTAAACGPWTTRAITGSCSSSGRPARLVQIEGAEPRFTIGRNVISQEVEEITSSSGDVFEQKLRDLKKEKQIAA